MDTGSAPHATGVSAREAEVLSGVAEHLTNAEIAERLFISVRTVESHVSSLLRKLGVADRRALAGFAAAVTDGAVPSRPRRTAAPLPAPLTPFVGRAAERAALAAALAGHRLVTAVGPGGIGKTRLALAVAAEQAGRFAGGVWYADLVPVTDGAMVAAALAAALGLGEQPGRSAEETVLAWFGDREALLVLDNCEHLVEAVVVLAERVLAACPGVTVLATSRARLLVPHERVFLVPGMTVSGDGGDAVELFLERAATAGGLAGTADRHRVARICRGLDGVALAIELAAARLPVLGLDGLEAGLDDRLGLLAGGRRLDDRHRSLRSALDWSYALLTEAERAILRRVCVFATAFTAQAAAALLAGWPPAGATPAGTPGAAGLAGLAEHSLLAAVTGPDGTRYRALETIRQYGAERLSECGELVEAHTRHLRWCLAEADALEDAQVLERAAGRAAFDQLAGELRAALEWAATTPDQRAGGYRLAIRLAELCFARGLPGEAQRRYEQAAALAADQHTAATALRDAAAAAASARRRTELLAPLRRQALGCGLELFDAYQMAAETSVAAGDLAAARELAEQVRDLPFYREEGHLATARLLVVTALAGDWDDTAAFGARFREGWERAGRPRAGNLSRGPYAAAAVCGLRGDDAGRAEWLTVVDALATPGVPVADIHHGEFFDALVLLHAGRPADAVTLLATPPEDFRAWYNGLWRPWYAALWAEAAVLAGDPAAAGRIGRARRCAAGNPIALAIVDRSAALAAGSRDGMLAAAERLNAAGCRYQWARTLVLAGGPERARGEDELAAMGAAPMAPG